MRKSSAGLVVSACLVALMWPAASSAQPHGPRPVGPRMGVGFYYGPYFGPYFYNPWFYSGYWGFPPWGYGYPYFYGAVGSNIRVQVQPKSAEVYVDGHLAGIVDQFDGMFQNLVVEPGSHEITVYLDGHKSIVQRLYLSVGKSYKIKGAMEKLAPGEPNEPRPAPAPEPASPAAESLVYPRPAESAPPVNAESRFGQVAVRVQPADAEIAIDGEPWKGPQGAERLVVHLAAGAHRVEIRKEGFDPFVTVIEVKSGEVTVLNVSLSRL